jgi:hypothetical protein
MVSRIGGRPEVRDHPHRTTSTSLAGTDVDATGRRLFPPGESMVDHALATDDQARQIGQQVHRSMLDRYDTTVLDGDERAAPSGSADTRGDRGDATSGLLMHQDGGDRSGTPLIPSRVLAPLHPGFQGRDVSGVDDNVAPATPQPELGNPPDATGHQGDIAEPVVRRLADGRAIVP